MNFRRQPGKPFQFHSIDPVKRQAELQKRFGLPQSLNNDMFVDFLNPGSMGAGINESSSLSGSPRLQHRVPIFTEKADKVNSEQNNVDGGYKPRVRVVPIQVEGVDGSKRHRTYSGPAGMVNQSNGICPEKLSESVPHADPMKSGGLRKQSQPRVYNIPVKIEPRDDKPKDELKSQTSEAAKKPKSEQNGCAASSVKIEEPEASKPDKTLPLKQIETVLDKLKVYKDEVEKFSGTSKDKQYRYLDEMLTRCMLDLDNVDTLGLDEVRRARKEAVRQVQHYVDLLDTKVNERVEKMESDTPPVENTKEGQMSCDTPPVAIPVSDNMTDEGGDIEMSGDIETEANDKSSNVVNDRSMAGDVEMVEEKVTTGDNLNENEDPIDGKENTSLAPDTEIDSVSCEVADCEMKDCDSKSEIVIEELDDKSNDSTPENCGNEAVSCVVSESPEFSVKDAIAEESGSEIVIEEVEDGTEDNRNLDKKESGHSINACDSTVDEINHSNKLTVEQLNTEVDTCDKNNIEPSSGACASVVQESVSSIEKL